ADVRPTPPVGGAEMRDEVPDVPVRAARYRGGGVRGRVGEREPHETGLRLQRVEHPLPGHARAHVRIPLSDGPRREQSGGRAALDTATTVPVPNTPSRSDSEAVPTATPSAPRCSSASIPKSALRGSRASATVRSALMKPMPSVPQLVMRLVASPSVTARWKGV